MKWRAACRISKDVCSSGNAICDRTLWWINEVYCDDGVCKPEFRVGADFRVGQFLDAVLLFLPAVRTESARIIANQCRF